MGFKLQINSAWSKRDTRPSLDSAWTELQKRLKSGEVGFFDAPVNEEISAAKLAIDAAGERTEKFKDCLFLGIGGSALGPKAVIEALAGKTVNGVRFHFLDHPGADLWSQTLQGLDPNATLVCSVSKSGSTFETLAQTMLALEWLTPKRWSSHFLAMTDPEQGDLRSWVEEKGLPSLPIHPSLGGRFSVFSPVGLFPLALAGLDARAFLEGAIRTRDRLTDDYGSTPEAQLVGHFFSLKDSHPTHVCMPYTHSLKSVGAWFVQLWGESLGKDGQGFTPVAALGPTDQHSLLQLLRDGPDDKVTLFVTTPAAKNPHGIPATLAETFGDRPSFTRLLGHSLDELVKIEHEAIAQVLDNQDRPAATLALGALDEAALGELMMSWAVMTAWLGTVLDLNPFDQPGVEEGKTYIKESLSGNHGNHS